MDTRTDWPVKAAIFGATGGIGAALCRVLVDRGTIVHGGSRSGEAPRHQFVRPFSFDLLDEESIAAAVRDMAGDPPDLVIVATGVLTLPDGTEPEKGMRAIDPEAMAQAFRINAIGPALVAKHMLPILPRDRRSVLAALSARVGSIGDNRLGGWHSYRSSKAALNMLVRNFSIEMKRTHDQAIIAALHPGTVDTPLSKPFQASLPKGQLTTRREAACNLLDVVRHLRPEDSGKLFDWRGQEIVP